MKIQSIFIWLQMGIYNFIKIDKRYSCVALTTKIYRNKMTTSFLQIVPSIQQTKEWRKNTEWIPQGNPMNVKSIK